MNVSVIVQTHFMIQICSPIWIMTLMDYDPSHETIMFGSFQKTLDWTGLLLINPTVLMQSLAGQIWLSPVGPLQTPVLTIQFGKSKHYNLD